MDLIPLKATPVRGPPYADCAALVHGVGSGDECGGISKVAHDKCD